ncbi:MAG: patatin-like phospholipase family protein [Cryobacterium sp.]|nr:patatin-like phospholipase family protein [Oligoflexia bacterium]
MYSPLTSPLLSHISLVLTGGGSRGAYQAGALRGIAEVLGPSADSFPFSSVCGVSAGAINAAYIASRSHEFREGVAGVCQLWGELKSDEILKDDLVTMVTFAARWARDLTFGGLVHGSRANHL